MKRTLITLAFLCGWAIAAYAGDAPARIEADFKISNFRFHNGETVPELVLHYVTLGTPERDASGHITNAVLLLHGTTASSLFFLGPNQSGGDLHKDLLAEGQPLDAARFYIVIPDAIGHGKSSKPSDGLHGKFPRYGYQDTVEAEHQLLTEGLHVDHLRLILGTSMGGFHAWLWGEKYPELMDALVPVASQPTQIAGRNYILRRLITEAIRHDPDWRDGNYDAQPIRWRAVLPIYEIMFLPAPRTQNKAPTREKSEAVFDGWMAFGKNVDANDILYAWDSSWDYDPGADLPKIRAKVLAINFADDPLNPPELGILEAAMKRVPNGHSVLLPASDRSFGHLNISHPELWNKYLAEILK